MSLKLNLANYEFEVKSGSLKLPTFDKAGGVSVYYICANIRFQTFTTKKGYQKVPLMHVSLKGVQVRIV